MNGITTVVESEPFLLLLLLLFYLRCLLFQHGLAHSSKGAVKKLYQQPQKKKVSVAVDTIFFHLSLLERSIQTIPHRNSWPIGCTAVYRLSEIPTQNMEVHWARATQWTRGAARLQLHEGC